MFSINSVFTTIQGEGALAGLPMVFVRFAGCSVGCSFCDTDYTKKMTIHIDELDAMVRRQRRSGWVWLTGGEPADQPWLGSFTARLRDRGYKVAVATSGTKHVDPANVDFMSVSPHTLELEVACGSQINLVPGLSGISIADFMKHDSSGFSGFEHKYVTPCDGKPETIQECKEFVLQNPGWKMGFQAHKQWGLS